MTLKKQFISLSSKNFIGAFTVHSIELNLFLHFFKKIILIVMELLIHQLKNQISMNNFNTEHINV